MWCKFVTVPSKFGERNHRSLPCGGGWAHYPQNFLGSTYERRENTSKLFEDLHLEAKARNWPGLTYGVYGRVLKEALSHQRDTPVAATLHRVTLQKVA